MENHCRKVYLQEIEKSEALTRLNRTWYTYRFSLTQISPEMFTSIKHYTIRY